MVEVSPDIASKRQSVPPRAAQWKDNNSPHNSQDMGFHEKKIICMVIIFKVGFRVFDSD